MQASDQIRTTIRDLEAAIIVKKRLLQSSRDQLEALKSNLQDLDTTLAVQQKDIASLQDELRQMQQLLPKTINLEQRLRI